MAEHILYRYKAHIIAANNKRDRDRERQRETERDRERERLRSTALRVLNVSPFFIIITARNSHGFSVVKPALIKVHYLGVALSVPSAAMARGPKKHLKCVAAPKH